uniref:Uncharacterized protein n=1 Tax=Leishmania guyanensis TaxID=5670 RepID=A0A1E1J966_LEIGU|nr:Hypothetical protein BN36_NA76470 [Leishmania guyanensis]CCM43474.1 Hypothetical protein BN36_NA76810 [Leishmania guyanensis]
MHKTHTLIAHEEVSVEGGTLRCGSVQRCAAEVRAFGSPPSLTPFLFSLPTHTHTHRHHHVSHAHIITNISFVAAF